MFASILLVTLLFAVSYFRAQCFTFLKRRNVKKNGKLLKLPPGPWGFPLIGHIPMLRKDGHKKLREWKEIYGPIFYIRLGTTPVVVINDTNMLKDAYLNDALSGRPHIQMFDEVIQNKGVLLADGDGQLEQRKFIIKTLKGFGFGFDSMEPSLQDDLAKFMDELQGSLGKPIIIKDFFKPLVINSLWELLMGAKFDASDPAIANTYELFDSTFSIKSSFAKLSVFAPWFGKWFGFLGYNKMLSEFRNFYSEMNRLINHYEKLHIPGDPKSFTGAYLDKVKVSTDPQSSFHPSFKTQPITTGDLILSAAGTLINAFDWLLLHLARNPDVQKKLQEEIDEVVGDSRVPTLNDRINMPYAVSVGLEVLRKSGAVGLSRRAIKDTEFHGYLIPKDTVIMKNPEACDNDSRYWKNPEQFNPLRFLDDNRKLKKTHLQPFGAGKRSCFGIAHTLNHMFLITTVFFQKFSISCTENMPSAVIEFDIPNSPKKFELIIDRR